MVAGALDRVLSGLPYAYPGPGGAVAVVRDGVVLERHCWGWADAERRVPFTRETLFRVCSITKQFTCGALLETVGDVDRLDADVRRALPLLAGVAPRAVHLMHNQSGLRDYWAATTLCGAAVERDFDAAESRRLIGMTRTLQFAPGSRYSYCNHNFRLLGEFAEVRGGAPLDALMRRAIWDRAGMATARLVPETETMPDGTVGYEGTVQAGFRPAVNRIIWVGDAAMVASLDDMAAWEVHIDRGRDDAGSLYRRLSAPVRFADGVAAQYGFGLARFTLAGRAATGHGGGLRGWSSFRCHVAAERLSVVVLFNHLSDARGAAQAVAAAVLGEPAAAARAVPEAGWAGNFLEPETGLAVRVEASGPGRMALWFAGYRPESLEDAGDGLLCSGTTRLRRDADGVWMERDADNLRSRLVPLGSPGRAGFAGVYRCAEYGAALTCVETGGAVYAAFSGHLGTGSMQVLRPVGADVWLMPCPRALDHAPPGDWTLQVLRDAENRVRAVRVGCWLARGLEFVVETASEM